MAAWRIVVRQVYAAGGQARRRDIEDGTDTAIKAAHAYGLLRRTSGEHDSGWSLTPLGVDWCEGRVVDIVGRHPLDRALYERFNKRPGRWPSPPGRHMRFAVTWLASLPRDVRIA